MCGRTKKELFKNAEHPPHYRLQSTPRNIRNLFKMADGRFPFLSFIPGLISTLIACFQANLALLILQADYSSRRQNIIRLFLSLPVSRGKRLDLPLVWLCFCPDFDILNCFCDFEKRHNNTNPHQRNLKTGQLIISRVHNNKHVCAYSWKKRK